MLAEKINSSAPPASPAEKLDPGLGNDALNTSTLLDRNKVVGVSGLYSYRIETDPANDGSLLDNATMTAVDSSGRVFTALAPIGVGAGLPEKAEQLVQKAGEAIANRIQRILGQESDADNQLRENLDLVQRVQQTRTIDLTRLVRDITGDPNRELNRPGATTPGFNDTVRWLSEQISITPRSLAA